MIVALRAIGWLIVLFVMAVGLMVLGAAAGGLVGYTP